MPKKKGHTPKKSGNRKSSDKTLPQTTGVGEKAKQKKLFQPVRGMKDILPKDGAYWQHLYRTAAGIAHAYNFSYIETPIVEEAALFIRSIGRGTDVVDKEMYLFEDSDGNKLCLRPEATASVARAFIHHGLVTAPQPVNMWYCGPMFRHDRPQAGRYRQFHQFSCESVGVRDAAIDAELIAVAYNFLRDLGIPSTVHMNSIGSTDDRARYVVELVSYLRTKRSYLSEESKKKMQRNPLRVLDSVIEQDQAVIEEAPQIIDWLSDESKAHFMKVLEYLDELSIPYMLRSTLVRGLDYYTDTVFEFYSDEEQPSGGQQQALGGGGRYDRLIEILGGVPTPACGFSIGLERVLSVLRKQEEATGETKIRDDRSPLFFAHLGEQARRRVLWLIESLRRDGIVLHHNIGKGSLKAQLELANKYGVSHTLILGQKELQDGTVVIRDMTSGIQEIIDQKKLKREVEKILAKSGGTVAPAAKTPAAKIDRKQGL